MLLSFSWLPKVGKVWLQLATQGRVGTSPGPREPSDVGAGPAVDEGQHTGRDTQQGQ